LAEARTESAGHARRCRCILRPDFTHAPDGRAQPTTVHSTGYGDSVASGSSSAAQRVPRCTT
jgi:hypothetical protein